MINTQMINNIDDYAEMLCGFRENAIYRLEDMLDLLDKYHKDGYPDQVYRLLGMIEDESRYIVLLTDDINQVVRHGKSEEEAE